jgi:2-haloacid dehalogenase
MRAGLSGAWIDRQGSPFPDVFRRPDLVCSSLTELAATLRSGSGGAVPA